MTRLFVLVEGETEETFINDLLAPRLYLLGFIAVSAKLMGNARLRSRRGGVRAWGAVKGDILRHLRNDGGCYVTTMVDYYGMPENSDPDRAWPGRADAKRLKHADKAKHVEQQMLAGIQKEMGNSWNPAQFLPFVVMHEFESLLFSDCKLFAIGVAKPELADHFQTIRSKFNCPEEINDSLTTHPSQRIVDLMPAYQKPLHGNIAALEIGVDPIASECPHFRQWLERLEKLAPSRSDLC